MPFQEPPAVRSRGKVLRTALLAENGTVDISGVRVAEAQTYAASGPGGSTARGFLGPTLHVNPGDTIEMTLDNQVDRAGGAPSAPAASSATPTSTASPPRPPRRRARSRSRTCTSTASTSRRANASKASTATASWSNLPNGEVPGSASRSRPTHDQGSFWYHAHPPRVHRRPGLPRPRRADPRSATRATTFRPASATSGRACSRSRTCRSTRRPAATATPRSPTTTTGGNATHRTVNGRVNPVMDIRPGETQLWRLANMSSAVWYNVALVDRRAATRATRSPSSRRTATRS